MKPLNLPWLADEKELLRHQVERYGPMTPEQRALEVFELCETAVTMMALHSSPAAVRDWRDPLPQSTRRILARLREEHRKRNA